MMYVVWHRRRWPRWFRDEWLGESGWALLVAVRTYNPDRGASFRTHLWNTCWSRVSELQAWINRQCRNEIEALMPCEVSAPALELPHPLLDELWKQAELLDQDFVRRRYVLDSPIGKIRNGARRHRGLIEKLRVAIQDLY